ncbi:MAG: hypothetical protein AABX10_04570 [Nanoarchaeota archaeon]
MVKKERPRILLELRVEDDGKMLLEPSKQVVTGVAIGEPQRMVVICGDEDDFTRRMEEIHQKAPPLANAYSPGRTFAEGDTECPLYFEMNNGRVERIDQTVQYFRLDDRSLRLARRAIY